METILRKQLKDFQRTFAAQHGRAPTKSDMAKEPAIKAAYDAWHAIRKATEASGSASASSSRKTEAGSSSRRAEGASTSSSGTSRAPVASSSSTGASTSTGPVLGTPRRRPAGSSSSSTVVGGAPFTTPTGARKRANPFASPSTATAATSPSAAAAATTTPKRQKPSAARPPTPPTIVKIYVTPPHHAASANGGINEDAQFDYANSPSRLKALIAARSNSPRTAAKTAAGAGAGGAGGSVPAFTPRTKARKRLRGEYVPPTPATSRTQPKLAIGKSGLNDDPDGEGQQAEEADDDDDMEEEDEEQDAPEGMGRPLKRRRNSENKAKPSQRDAPLVGLGKARTLRRSTSSASSICVKREPVGATPKAEATASQAGVKGKGKGQARAQAQAQAQDGEDIVMADVANVKAAPGHAAEPTSADARGDTRLAPVRQPNRRAPSAPKWALSQIELSDAESDETTTDAKLTRSADGYHAKKSSSASAAASEGSKGVSPTKQTITLAPYMRHGTLRAKLEQDERKRAANRLVRTTSLSATSLDPASNGANGQADADEDDDDDDDFLYALPTSARLFARTNSDPLGRTTATQADRAADTSHGDGDSKEAAVAAALSSKLGMPATDVARFLSAQNRGAAQAQRARSRAMLRALLGEMEELDLDSEQRQGGGGGGDANEPAGGAAAAGTARAKNWGQAKENNRDKTADGKKKGRKTKKDANAVAAEAPAASASSSSATKGAAGPGTPRAALLLRQFARVGRAGVGAAEMSEGSGSDSDDADSFLEADEDSDEGPIQGAGSREEEDDDDGRDADESCIDSPSEEDAQHTSRRLGTSPAGKPSQTWSKRQQQQQLSRTGSHRRSRRAGKRAHHGGGSDEDWDSEVASDEYGLGDGQMDETDII